MGAEPSQAEIEAAAEALHRPGWGGNDGVAAKFWAKMSEREKAEWLDIARAVLAAVLPSHDERIRAGLADEIKAEMAKRYNEGAETVGDHACLHGLTVAEQIVRGQS